MRDAVLTMLTMQDRMNTRVHEDWRSQGYSWHRAIWVEAAEMVEHHGYKWWKHQKPDMAQVQLEIIDIWHFGMSLRIMQGEDLESLAQTLATELAEPAQPTPAFLDAADSLAGIAAAQRDFCGRAFATLMDAAGLDFATLYRQYLGKNVLNFFRQDNGYKEGSYRKLWDGREDNEHLMELLLGIDTDDADAESTLYTALEARYTATG